MLGLQLLLLLRKLLRLRWLLLLLMLLLEMSHWWHLESAFDVADNSRSPRRTILRGGALLVRCEQRRSSACTP